MRSVFVLLAALWIAFPEIARADALHVIAAGSLTDAFNDLLRRFPAPRNEIATPEFGPSGLMREKIEAGEPADIFASANMDHARRLAAGHPERSVINFTRNRLCALARTSISLTAENLLDRLLDPAVRLATSTPGADPGGDYAWAVFSRAEAFHSGAQSLLEAKAMPLVGGGVNTPLLVPGKGAVEGVFLADRADVMLGYCSGSAEVMRTVPDLSTVPLPPSLSPAPAYGMVLLNANPLTLRFGIFVMSEEGQAVLRAHGFEPTAFVEPGQPLRGLLIERAGALPKVMLLEAIMAVRAITQHAAIEHDDREWTGPLLWDVLVASGMIDPAKAAEQVHLTVHVIGADGWTAAFGMAEFSPQFAGRPLQLATKMNGNPVPGTGLRLVVPSEARGGRSVRDVIRIDIN
jgi:ABC-type molybdate transport system substrate-binding protein